MTELKKILNERITRMFDYGADYFDIHPLSTEINYSDIIGLWCDFEKKKFLEFISVEQKIFDEKENNHINIVELCKKDTVFSLVLEDLFQFHFNYKSEDMLLFYLKDTNIALLKLKSYHPYYVLEEEKYITEKDELSKKGIVLQKELEDNTSPYWSILIENKEIINSLNSICEEYPSNTLCMLAY